MLAYLKKSTLVLAAVSTATAMTPLSSPASAQGWRNGNPCRGLDGRARARCERNADRRDDRWDRERERRKDAKTDGIVAGVVGTAILGGIIAAAASGSKKRSSDDRDNYCDDRYGEGGDRSGEYRASDGRWYPCP